MDSELTRAAVQARDSARKIAQSSNDGDIESLAKTVEALAAAIEQYARDAD